MARQTFASVWDAVEEDPADAANMRARSAVMIALRERIEHWRGGPAKAAKRVGLTQRRLDDLMRGRLDKFTLDELMNLAQAAGLGVRVEIDAAA